MAALDLHKGRQIHPGFLVLVCVDGASAFWALPTRLGNKSLFCFQEGVI